MSRIKFVSDVANRIGLPYEDVHKVFKALRTTAIEKLGDCQEVVIPGLCRMSLRLTSPEQRSGFGNFPVTKTLASYRVRCRIHRAAETEVHDQLAIDDTPVDLLSLCGG